MPVPRMRAEDCFLLVIDVQERLLPTIVDAQQVVTNGSVLLRLAGLLEMPHLVTEQYPRGLGRTDERITSAMRDPAQRVEKTRFSALVDVVQDQLNEWERGSVLIAGLEAHVCVLQTVLDLQTQGRQCFVISDATSASQREQIPHAYRRMERSGAIITGTMSVLYELLEDASNPKFKAALELAKAIEG